MSNLNEIKLFTIQSKSQLIIKKKNILSSSNALCRVYYAVTILLTIFLNVLLVVFFFLSIHLSTYSSIERIFRCIFSFSIQPKSVDVHWNQIADSSTTNACKFHTKTNLHLSYHIYWFHSQPTGKINI